MSHCDTIHPLLDDYVDGQLDDATTRRVDDHLQGCAPCREDLETLRRLVSELADLPDSISPSRDLWPEIDRRLTPRRAPGLQRWSTWALAAALLLSVSAGWLWFDARNAPAQDALPGRATTSGARAETIVARPAAVSSGPASELAAASAELRRALEAQREELPPDTQAVIDRNLKIIEDAIAEIEASMERAPGDPRLESQLATYRQREVELLRRVTRATRKL